MAHGLTQTQCEVETLFMFVAGSDTTAAAMKITMLYIISTPRVYQQLKTEIATALREGRASSPITQAEARALPYLQAVIYEGLRIRPVTTSSLSKEVPPGGDTVHGKFIPGGAFIGTNAPALLRSRELFGEDADTFRPERFLGLDRARLAEMRRNVELTFGYGRWMCAGKPIAFMELDKVYFEVCALGDRYREAVYSPGYGLADKEQPSYSVTSTSSSWTPSGPLSLRATPLSRMLA